MGTLQLRHDTLVNKPTLSAGEAFACTDNRELIVGMPSGGDMVIPDSLISHTYAELSTMIAGSGSLVAGAKYLISDYASVHTIPSTTDTNTPTAEPLVVTAISSNEFAPIAYSPSFPNDVIYYEFTSDQAVVAGCTKGYIYRRVDTIQNNDIPFDFRSVKFRRWQISASLSDTTGAIADYTAGQVVLKTGGAQLYIKLNAKTAVLFTDTGSWKRFEWDNLTYVSPTATNWGININLTIPCSALYTDYLMFQSYPTYHSNTIMGVGVNLLVNCNNVIFGAGFTSNSIGANFYNNSIDANFTSNSIGANFYNNSIGATFSYNSIGAGFTYNFIGAGFISNSIGANFYNNSIGANFTSNSIGAGFYNNSIGAGFSGFTIIASFQSNTVSDNFSRGVDLSSANLVYVAYTKFWFITPDGTYQLYYFTDGATALTTAEITA